MKKPRALLSLHDVTPAFQPQIQRAWSSLQRWGTFPDAPPALLVVPRYHDRWPLTDHPEFVSWLADARAAGAEVVLHGLTHEAARTARRVEGVIERAKARFLTAGEGEFQTLTYYQTARALREGLELLEAALDDRPSGFVAPAWLESVHTARALAAQGFGYHEDHLFIDDLARDRRLFVPAITFTGRSRARAIASIGWAKAMAPLLRAPVDIRLALHPVDFDHDDLVAAIGELVEVISQRRQWTTYRELLGADGGTEVRRPHSEGS